MALYSKIIKRLGEFRSLTPLAAITTFLPMAGSSVLLLVGYPLGIWLRENWMIGAPAYFIGVLIFCGAALLPTNVIGLIGGWAFSFDLGIVVLMAGIVGASLVSYVVHQRITSSNLSDIAERHPKARAVYHALVGRGFWRTTLIVFLLRLSIVMPFAFTNFLLASAKVSWKSFTVGTLFGMLPRSSAVVFAGASLSELDLNNTGDLWIIALGLIATMAAMIVMSIVGRRALENLTLNSELLARDRE